MTRPKIPRRLGPKLTGSTQMTFFGQHHVIGSFIVPKTEKHRVPRFAVGSQFSLGNLSYDLGRNVTPAR
jgi:hypothetical protein